MTAKYWQKGEVLDYKASAAVKNGEVVSLGTRIGVAGEDIAAGETGHLHVVGVFEMEKATGAMTMGAAVYYDEAAKKITTVASTGESSGLRECAGGLRCRPCGQRRRNRTGEAAGLRARRKGT